MSLTVLQVAYPLAPVGPDAAGGAEQALAMLDRALVAAGHRSLVIACAPSRTAGTLLPIPPPPAALTPAARAAAQAAVRAALAAALREHRVDLVHLHGLDYAAYLPPPGVPVLVTLHLPLAWYPPEALAPARPDTLLCCVSHAQRRTWPGGAPAHVPVIGNGVPVAALGAPAYRKRDYVAALARVCPEKGLHHALDAACAAGAALLLAGALYGYPEHRDYFAREIAPRLDAQRRYVGALGARAKRRLLAGARCLLVPSLAAETSSLVAMEALACGTPVVAFPAGALAEVVEHGVTGFIVPDAAAMARAIPAVAGLDSAVCRARASQRYDAARMTGEYLALYGALAGAARGAA